MKPDAPKPTHPESIAGTNTERSMRAALKRRLDTLDSHRAPFAPPAVPDHVLLGRIGTGAYGEVWLARSALGTLRAVKVVYRARFEDERPFDREFQGILKYEPVSRTHEGLVQVLHVGRNDQAGCFYYVMELADGAEGKVICESVTSRSVGTPTQGATGSPNTDSPINDYFPKTLRSVLRQHQRLAPADAAQLTLRLAGALAHLHLNGLVHRDLKPSNVIFVNGQPKLADVGLVAGVGDSRSFVGTEGFIPPEGPGTVAADIYSLGKLLYELATGRDRMDFPLLPPLATESGQSRAVSRSDAEPRSQYEHRRRDEALLELNEIITRACAPKPEQRYATAAEFQADLQLFLAGRSLRESRKLERQLVWLQRFALAAGLAIACALGVAWFARRAEAAAQERARQSLVQAQVEAGLRTRAESAEHEARSQLYTALREQARATVRSGEIGHRVRTLEAVRRAAAISNTVELQRVALTALALPDVRFEREWSGGSTVTALHFDSTFQRMAVARGPGAVEIRSVPDIKLLATLPPQGEGDTYFTAWSPGDRYLAVRRDHDAAGDRADVEVWAIAAVRSVLLLRDVPRGALGFHPALPRLVTATSDGPVTVWDIESGKKLASYVIHGAPDALEFSPDGKRIAASYPSAGSWTISVHDAEHGGVLAAGHFVDRIPNVAWHRRGQWIAAPDHAGEVHLMDSQTGAALPLGRHKSRAYHVAFSPDGRYLVSGGWDNELICWDLPTRQRSFTLPINSSKLFFRADGRQCATLFEGRVQFYAFESPTGHRDFGALLGSQVNNAAFSSDGRWLAASGDKQLGVWQVNSETPAALISEAADARPFFTPDSTELLGSSREDACFRWQIAAGEGPLARLKRVPLSMPADFTALCLASNRIVWTSHQGSRTSALNESTNRNAWMPTLPGVSQASPHGPWLSIYRPFTPLLQVYRLPGLETAAKFTAQANISAVTFPPSGHVVATVSRRTLEIWDIKTGQRTRVITNCSHVVFAPGGHRAWMLLNRVAGLYQLDTLQPLALLPGDTTPLALSPEGRHLAVSVAARSLQVWDLVEVRRHLGELGMDWSDP